MVLGDLDDKKLLARAVKNSDLFVNATRVGMAPFDDECVIDEDMLHEGLLLLIRFTNRVKQSLFVWQKSMVYKPHQDLGCFSNKLRWVRKFGLISKCPLIILRKSFFNWALI